MTDVDVALPVVPPTGIRPPAATGGKARETAQAFEAVFLGQMTQMMMTSGQGAAEYAGGHGEEMFRSVLAEKIGTEMARSGGIGLAPAVMAQIIKLQGGNGDGR
jgi:flagellar protein FlgJ